MPGDTPLHQLGECTAAARRRWEHDDRCCVCSLPIADAATATYTPCIGRLAHPGRCTTIVLKEALRVALRGRTLAPSNPEAS